jgi:hypothetical protein
MCEVYKICRRSEEGLEGRNEGKADSEDGGRLIEGSGFRGAGSEAPVEAGG